MSKSILLCVDVFGAYARSNPKTTKKIVAFADAVRPHMPIVWIRLNNYWNDRAARVMRKAGITPAELNEGDLNLGHMDDYAIGKRGQDAFENTGLLKLFAQKGNPSALVCGFMTPLCVHDTALGARQAGLDVRLLEDLSAHEADSNRDEASDKALAHLRQNQIPLINHQHILNRL